MPQGKKEIEESLKRKPGYKRAQIQTYLTAPEWYNVQVSQSYGKFIKHTPFYQFPFFKEIRSFWKVFGGSWNHARQHASFWELATSEYTLMNLFIGITMTVEFAAKGLISFPVSCIYGSQDKKEPEFIEMLVDSQEANLSLIDRRIEVIKEYEHTKLKNIRIPRYLPATEILCKLAEKHIKCVNISGQKKVQVDVLIEKEKEDLLLDTDACKKLYEMTDETEIEKRVFALEIAVEELDSELLRLQQNGISIHYIHDF